jgi:hypothetical protein
MHVLFYYYFVLVLFFFFCSIGRICDCYYKTYKWEHISQVPDGAIGTRHSTSKTQKNMSYDDE